MIEEPHEVCGSSNYLKLKNVDDMHAESTLILVPKRLLEEFYQEMTVKQKIKSDVEKFTEGVQSGSFKSDLICSQNSDLEDEGPEFKKRTEIKDEKIKKDIEYHKTKLEFEKRQIGWLEFEKDENMDDAQASMLEASILTQENIARESFCALESL